MKTFRNLAFLGLVAVLFAVDESPVEAFMTPTFDNCSDGCTCTVNPQNWLEVTAECPDTAGVNECSYGFSACQTYCLELGPYLDAEYPGYSHSCGLWEFGGEGCVPVGLEPPTNWLCGCYCWIT